MITMNWTLRTAEKKDFNRINELFVEMLKTIYSTDQVNGYSEGDLDRFFAGGDHRICVAVADNVIVAFLSIEVYREAKEFLYLDDFSVTKKYRNCGIGTEMLCFAERYAKEIHVPAVCLHVEKSNYGALRLYERLGYKIHEDQGHRCFMMKNI